MPLNIFNIKVDYFALSYVLRNKRRREKNLLLKDFNFNVKTFIIYGAGSKSIPSSKTGPKLNFVENLEKNYVIIFVYFNKK